MQVPRVQAMNEQAVHMAETVLEYSVAASRLDSRSKSQGVVVQLKLNKGLMIPHEIKPTPNECPKISRG